jgi:hypothetical protein
MRRRYITATATDDDLVIPEKASAEEGPSECEERNLISTG